MLYCLATLLVYMTLQCTGSGYEQSFQTFFLHILYPFCRFLQAKLYHILRETDVEALTKFAYRLHLHPLNGLTPILTCIYRRSLPNATFGSGKNYHQPKFALAKYLAYAIFIHCVPKIQRFPLSTYVDFWPTFHNRTDIKLQVQVCQAVQLRIFGAFAHLFL